MLVAQARAGTVEIIDVDGESDLQSLYGLRVPVLMADDTVAMEGRFDEAALARLMNPAGSSRR